jgi:hypothetical protein
MKIDELKNKREKLVSEMEKLVNTNFLSSDDKKKINDLGEQIQKLDGEIDAKSIQSLLSSSFSQNRISGTDVDDFKNWLTQVASAKSMEIPANFVLKANNPILSTTDTPSHTRNVNEIGVLYSPSETLLRGLGVVINTNREGEQVYPLFSQQVASFVDEASSNTLSDMEPTSITLKPKRISITQEITREQIKSTNESYLDKVLENLYNGIWNGVAERYFDTLESDTSTMSLSNSISYSKLCDMEASLGTYAIDDMAYVMRPETKSYLKKTPWNTNGDPIWNNQNMVNGHKAHSSSFVNVENVFLGDYSKTVIDNWGDGITFYVDPLTKARNGILIITAEAFFNTAVLDKRAFSVIVDASTF